MPLLVKELPAELRPATRFDHVGARGMSSVELLQLVTGAKDLDALSALVTAAGGIGELSQMEVSQLCEVDGIGPAAAKAIVAALELGRRALAAAPERIAIRTPADVVNLCMLEMSLLPHEVLDVYCLDTKNNVKQVRRVYTGNINSIIVQVGQVLRPAIVNNCPSVIVVHNHPSGDPTPSPEDVRVTQLLVEGGRLLDVQVLDHLVIGRNRFVSMKERGLGF